MSGEVVAMPFRRSGDGEGERRFAEALRVAEALLFAAEAPLSAEEIGHLLPADCAVDEVLAELERRYAGRGVQLARLAGKWMFRTAPDLGHLLRRQSEEPRKLSRAALEVLAVIAYHQPVTRAEMEHLRGVSTGKGTLDVLLEAGFVKMRGRRRTPGRPVTYGTTEAFLVQFNLDRVSDLPGLEELAAQGLIDPALAAGLVSPRPSDAPALSAEEDPLEPDLFEIMREERLDAEAELDPLDPDEPDDGRASPAPKDRASDRDG